MSADQIGLWVGFVLTLMIFSYLLSDNFLYRLAVYAFVGLTAGFIVRVTVEAAILPWLRGTLGSGDPLTQILGVIPIVFAVLLIFKANPRLSPLGSIPLAWIIGVGAAVAVVGAISGTILPLAGAAGSAVGVDAVNGFLIVLGVIATLVYFQYSARRLPNGMIRRGLLPRVLGAIGQGVIAVTLGALYGGAILTGLVVFSERIAFLIGRLGG